MTLNPTPLETTRKYDLSLIISIYLKWLSMVEPAINDLRNAAFAWYLMKYYWALIYKFKLLN